MVFGEILAFIVMIVALPVLFAVYKLIKFNAYFLYHKSHAENQQFSFLWKDLHTYLVASNAYTNLFLLVRKTVVITVIVSCSDYPLIQLGAGIAGALAFGVFAVFNQPYTNWEMQVNVIGQELLLLASYGSTLLLKMSIDGQNSADIKSKSKLALNVITATIMYELFFSVFIPYIWPLIRPKNKVKVVASQVVPEFFLTQKFGNTDRIKFGTQADTAMQSSIVPGQEKDLSIWERKNVALNQVADEKEGNERRTKKYQAKVMPFSKMKQGNDEVIFKQHNIFENRNQKQREREPSEEESLSDDNMHTRAVSNVQFVANA